VIALDSAPCFRVFKRGPAFVSLRFFDCVFRCLLPMVLWSRVQMCCF